MSGKRNNQSPLVTDGIHLQDGNFKWAIPADVLRGLVATGVTGSGVVLANVMQKFSLLHETKDAETGESRGDLPVNYTVSVRITRDALPGNSAESDAVERAARESKAKQDERKATETKERQASIAAAVNMTRDMIREGLTIGSQRVAPGPSAVETIKTAAEILPVVKALQASLTQQ